ncbi:Putative DNA-binding protein [Alloactinosynnema sp. L-07]|uniref:helix-turn-helix domain-containing protein n=1 Tax=Alloactinosynnema sp. L-07 TaxID=1653480 RepID=UPI00065EFFDB|nr:helix-turn-helix transcriptional regulator [Alloactinosynnema sp. L-07]CRK59939.1 Putative DNA-binding protein [Alloactinosynnema sp. L-07]
MGERGPGPVIIRRRLGKDLRALRDKAGVSMAEAADYVGIGKPTMSKIELGRQNIGLGNLRALLGLYAIDGDLFDELLSKGKQANQKDWWSSYGDTVPDWFRTYIGMESDADQILTYECEFIPGLLQTEDYTAVVRRAFRPDVEEGDPQRHAALRSARQRHLVGDDPPGFHAVINEAVLHRVVGSPAVMRAQLKHVMERAKLDHVRVQVLPFSAGAHPAMNGAFSILQFEEAALSTVYVEIEPGGLYPERAIDISRYRLVFNQIAELALDEAKSLALIGKLAKQL